MNQRNVALGVVAAIAVTVLIAKRVNTNGHASISTSAYGSSDSPIVGKWYEENHQELFEVLPGETVLLHDFSSSSDNKISGQWNAAGPSAYHILLGGISNISATLSNNNSVMTTTATSGTYNYYKCSERVKCPL